MSNESRWMVVSQGGVDPIGPFPTSVIERLIKSEKLSKESYCWKAGWKEWQSLRTCDVFQPLIDFVASVWKVQNCSDEMTTNELIHRFITLNTIDGFTLVQKQSNHNDDDTWVEFNTILQLKESIQEIQQQNEIEKRIKKQKKETFNETSSLNLLSNEENGQSYVYDAETCRWMTPVEKIQDELNILQENKESATNNKKQHHYDPIKKEKKRKKSEKWVTPKVNHWIYLTGLPSGVTSSEIATFCAKCGLIEENPKSGDPRIKLYRDEEGEAKGDASVCFAHEASVGLAIQLLDTSLFLNTSNVVNVSIAEFKQKGTTFIKRNRIKLDQKDKIRKRQQQQSLGWNEGEDVKAMKIMVLKNMFTSKDITNGGETFTDELKKDVFEECSSFGPVEKVRNIYNYNV